MKGKIYKIENRTIFNWEWTCKVKIDYENEKVKEAVKEMVEFWGFWEQDLKLNDGDYLKTFLQRLGSTVLSIQVRNNYNIKGIISEFDDLEGFTRMDGSEGILLLEVDYDPMEAELSDFDVELVEDQESTQ